DLRRSLGLRPLHPRKRTSAGTSRRVRFVAKPAASNRSRQPIIRSPRRRAAGTPPGWLGGATKSTRFSRGRSPPPPRRPQPSPYDHERGKVPARLRVEPQGYFVSVIAV